MSRQRKSKRFTNTTGKAQWSLLAIIGIAITVAALAVWLSVPTTAAEDADIVVYKSPACSCCENWIAHLRFRAAHAAHKTVALLEAQEGGEVRCRSRLHQDEKSLSWERVIASSRSSFPGDCPASPLVLLALEKLGIQQVQFPKESIEAELSLHSLLSRAGKFLCEIDVLKQAEGCLRKRLRVARGHQQAADAVLDNLCGPARPRCHNRKAARHCF